MTMAWTGSNRDVYRREGILHNCTVNCSGTEPMQVYSIQPTWWHYASVSYVCTNPTWLSKQKLKDSRWGQGSRCAERHQSSESWERSTLIASDGSQIKCAPYTLFEAELMLWSKNSKDCFYPSYILICFSSLVLFFLFHLIHVFI